MFKYLMWRKFDVQQEQNKKNISYFLISLFDLSYEAKHVLYVDSVTVTL